MKLRTFLAGVIGLAVVSSGLRSEIKAGGYFAFSYLKGQTQSDIGRGSFQDLQAGLLATGEAAPRFPFAMEVRTKGESRFELEQAWIGVALSRAVNVRAGLFLVPFGQYNIANRPHESPLIDTPLHLAALYPASWREIGLSVDGRIGFLTFAGYLGNGLAEAEYPRQGQQFSDNNRGKGLGGRLGLLLGEGIEAGLSLYSGKGDPGGERKITLKGLDAVWATQDWEIRSEYARGEWESPAPFDRGKSEGYFVVLIWKLGGISPVLSYQKMDAEDPFRGPGFLPSGSPGSGIISHGKRWTFGATYTLTRGVILNAEYDVNGETGDSLKNNVFRIQAVLSF